jgi:hypothetical protein
MLGLTEVVEYYADLRKAFQSSVPASAIPKDTDKHDAVEIVEALVGEAWEWLE